MNDLDVEIEISVCQMENRENRLEIIIGAKSLAPPRKLKYIGKYWKFIRIYCDEFEIYWKLLLEQKVWVVPGNSIYWNMLEIYQNMYIGNRYWRGKSLAINIYRNILGIYQIYWKLLLERKVRLVPGNQRRPNKLLHKSLSTYHQIHVILSKTSKIISS